MDLDSGYAHFRDPALLAEAAQARCRTGASPIIVLTQAITRDSKPVLDVLAGLLQDRGLTGGTKLHMLSLLELLSAEKSAEEILAGLLQKAAAFDGLLFLGDAYRYGYDARRTTELLAGLTRHYRQRPGCSPLVIKLPPETDQQLLRAVPGLWEHCLNLGAAPMEARGSQSRPVPPETPRESPPKRLPREEYAPKRGNTGVWYRDDQQLLRWEYEGLVNYLKQKNLRCNVAPNTVIPGRYRIFVSLRIRELGECDIAIVYDADFGRNNPHAVKVAIRCQAQQQLNYRLAKVRREYDPACNAWLLQLPPSRNAQAYGSAAAAVFETLILSMK